MNTTQRTKALLGLSPLAFLVVSLLSLVLTSGAFELVHARSVHALTAEKIRTYSGDISTSTAVVTGATGTKLHVRSADISVTSTASVWTFQDGVSGTAVWKIYLAAGAPQDVTNPFGSAGLTLTQNVLAASPGTEAILTLNVRTTDE